ncbi:hypothetical protein LOZ66_001655 [Ophidiomyces ophidiicola]|nr:hypothetical protein LOZ66_001655 [Ophidiomyces ophidiicola]
MLTPSCENEQPENFHNECTKSKEIPPDVPVLTNSSLEALQNSEHRELMDLVDSLRRTGLSSVLQLPQIVVCGDQSSGKSSVLEAITEIPFPRRENLCTRFATEISMRREAKESIICKINPDGGRTEDELVKLRSFSRHIQTFEELPSIINDVTAVLGLNEHRAFAKDVLSIEICGPSRPQLTLVDLPGLIHSANKSQSEGDVDLIKSLVEDYISQQRTVILAVISAKNDYANQVILKNCRRFDPRGTRTLGVITKPDFLLPNSENERVWIDLARNQDIYFELGWHLLKNRGDTEHHDTPAERNLKEMAFFSTGNFKNLPQRMKGISSLRGRLSQLLLQHMRRELPLLKRELDDMAQNVHNELQILGRSRGSLAEKRSFLADIFHTAYDTVKMGLDGNYEDKFFGVIETDAPIEHEKNVRRLRAVIQHLNISFARKMSQTGPEDQIENPSLTDFGEESMASSIEREINEDSQSSRSSMEPLKTTITIEKVVQMLGRSRGREIPGTFNPMLISHLFWEQSEDWVAIAERHIVRVHAACTKFLHFILDHATAPEIKQQLFDFAVAPVMKSIHQAALDELRKVEQDKNRHPITYNHYFTDSLQKANQESYAAGIQTLAKKATINVNEMTWTSGKAYETKGYVDPIILNEILPQAVKQNMDKFSAEQAVNASNAYYKAERKYFIDVVAKQVVERHLVAPLAGVFSPRVLACYSDKEINFLAAESAEVVQLRQHLENKYGMLQQGQEAFRMAMGQPVGLA